MVNGFTCKRQDKLESAEFSISLLNTFIKFIHFLFSHSMKLLDLSPENRPRERLQQQGPQVLSTAELLALILKSGTKKESILDLCNNLLAKYSLEQLPHATIQELTQEHGIGQAKASQIIALFELYKRIPLTNVQEQPLHSASDVVQRYQRKFQHLNQEQCLALYLDTKNKLIKEQIISIGTLNSSLIHPREIFNGAIKHTSNAVVVIHNHPSGDPTPSEEDLKVTKILHKAGEIIGIRLLDHIIIGNGTWWSWKENSSKHHHNV